MHHGSLPIINFSVLPIQCKLTKSRLLYSLRCNCIPLCLNLSFLYGRESCKNVTFICYKVYINIVYILSIFFIWFTKSIQSPISIIYKFERRRRCTTIAYNLIKCQTIQQTTYFFIFSLANILVISV